MGDLVRQYGGFTPVMEKLESVGVKPGHFRRLQLDQDYLLRIGQAFRGQSGPIPYKLARKFFDIGRTFFGPEVWQDHFKPQKRDLPEVPEFPWGEDVLESQCALSAMAEDRFALVKDTHVAFLGLETLHGVPLTISRWERVMKQKGLRFDILNPEWEMAQFEKEVRPQFRWYLVYNGIVPGSKGKAYQEQAAMLPSEYEIPSIAEIITWQCLVYAMNDRCDVYPADDVTLRCRESSRDDWGWLRILVAARKDHLYINSNPDVAKHRIGITASRKYPA